jgi:predicted DNA-binding transcriptional regulator AlpA
VQANITALPNTEGRKLPTIRNKRMAIPQPDGTEIINRPELGFRLGCSERQIDHLVVSKKLPAIRLGAKSVRFIWPSCLEALR